MQPVINYVAVVVAAVAQFIVGAIWYALLFGKKWGELVGMTEETAKQMNANPALLYGLPFIAYLVSCYVLAHFVHYTNAKTAKEGAQTGFWAWLGFTATVLFIQYHFQNKAFALWAIDAGYNLVAFIAAGMILAVWKKKQA